MLLRYRSLIKITATRSTLHDAITPCFQTLHLIKAVQPGNVLRPSADIRPKNRLQCRGYAHRDSEDLSSNHESCQLL